MLHLQMVIADYFYTNIGMWLHNSYISYLKSDRCIAYIFKYFLISCLCPLDKTSFLRRVVYHCLLMIHRRCVLWLCCTWVFFAIRWMVTNWSSLEVVYGHLHEAMYKQAFNMLTQINIIWSIKHIWNICLIKYFLSVVNSNKQRSNETLVGT